MGVGPGFGLRSCIYEKPSPHQYIFFSHKRHDVKIGKLFEG